MSSVEDDAVTAMPANNARLEAAAAEYERHSGSLSGPTGRLGLLVHLAVYDVAGSAHDRSPIGERALSLPAALLDAVPDPDEAGDQAVSEYRLAWERWLLDVQAAIRVITVPCAGCGGSALCRRCASTGRCPVCTVSLVRRALLTLADSAGEG